jgi:hypothetical protein
MITDTIHKIEENIKNTKNIDPKKKSELLGLIANLKKEVLDFSTVDMDNAESIVNFAKVSTYETVRGNPYDKLKSLSLQGLTMSVQKFEVSHPGLVSAVNSVCNYLANIGI